jgi:hypothetical protein
LWLLLKNKKEMKDEENRQRISQLSQSLMGKRLEKNAQPQIDLMVQRGCVNGSQN